MAVVQYYKVKEYFAELWKHSDTRFWVRKDTSNIAASNLTLFLKHFMQPVQFPFCYSDLNHISNQSTKHREGNYKSRKNN